MGTKGRTNTLSNKIPQRLDVVALLPFHQCFAKAILVDIVVLGTCLPPSIPVGNDEWGRPGIFPSVRKPLTFGPPSCWVALNSSVPPGRHLLPELPSLGSVVSGASRSRRLNDIRRAVGID